MQRNYDSSLVKTAFPFHEHLTRIYCTSIYEIAKSHLRKKKWQKLDITCSSSCCCLSRVWRSIYCLISRKKLCGVCTKTLKKTDKRITCVICKKQVHIRCNLLTRENFKNISISRNDEDRFCINCIDENMPFSKLSENEFSLINKFGIISINDEHDQLDFLTSIQNANLKNINDIIKKLPLKMRMIMKPLLILTVSIITQKNLWNSKLRHPKRFPSFI